jgi:hypothetical protein
MRRSRGPGNGDRDPSLAWVRAAAEDFACTGDRGTLFKLDPRRIVDQAGTRPRRRQLAEAMAWWHWYRYLALPGRSGLAEREAAISYFRRLRWTAPGRIPAPIKRECWAWRRPRPSRSKASPSQPSGPWPALSAVDLILTGFGSEEDARVAALERRLHRNGDITVVAELVECYHRMAGRTTDKRERAALATDIASALNTHARATGSEDAATQGEEALSDAISETPADDPHWISRLALSGAHQRQRFEQGVGAAALHAAIATFQQIAPRIWERAPPDLYVIELLGLALLDRHRIKGSLEDLLATTRAWCDLVDAAPPDRPEAVRWRRQRDECVRGLVTVVGVDAVDQLFTAARDPARLRRQLQWLARASTTVDPRSLQPRLEAARALVAALPGHHPDRPKALLLFSEVYHDHWDATANLDALIHAVDTAQLALHAIGPRHRLRRIGLTMFAEFATTRANLFSSQRLANEAVAAAREALALAGRGSRRRVDQLHTLALALDVLGFTADDPHPLRAAVRHHREILKRTSRRGEDYPKRLCNLATSLQRLHSRHRDPALIDEAVAVSRLALTASATTHAIEPLLLMNLGSALASQAEAGQGGEPLIEATQVLRTAIGQVPPEHPDRHRVSGALGRVLHMRYTLDGDAGCLVESAALARQVLAAIRVDHPWRPQSALDLARALADLSQRREQAAAAGADDLRKEALALYRAVTESSATPRQVRLWAAREQLELAQADGDPEAAQRSLVNALAEVSTLTDRELTGLERIRALGRLEGLGVEAAAAALAGGTPERAVETLERSRAVLFQDALGIHSGWTRLQREAPDLAAELATVEEAFAMTDFVSHHSTLEIQVRKRPEAGARSRRRDGWSKPTVVDVHSEVAEDTRRLAAQRQRIVARVRALPGFAGFLDPPRLASLRPALAGATVVVLNPHRRGADALLIPGQPAEPVMHLPLPGVTRELVEQRVERLRSAVAGATDPAWSFPQRQAAQEAIHEILEWLWDRVTGPVLDRIAPPGTGHPGGQRVWWCPAGAFAQLPLHAAGHHRDTGAGVPRTVFDRVVFSYTPTVAALAHTRGRSPGPAGARPALVVAVAEAKGAPPLPQVEAEAQQLAQLLPGCTVVRGPQANLDRIDDALRTHPVAHFACHGRADASISTLFRSGLLLSDRHRLTPAHVHSLQLASAELAFLSACDSAAPDRRLPDQSLHLAAAFHLAGFRSVIGTLWRTPDSPRIAEAFYTALTAGGARPPDPSVAPTALNEVLRRTRDEFVAVPTRWAGHIHVGA